MTTIAPEATTDETDVEATETPAVPAPRTAEALQTVTPDDTFRVSLRSADLDITGPFVGGDVRPGDQVTLWVTGEVDNLMSFAGHRGGVSHTYSVKPAALSSVPVRHARTPEESRARMADLAAQLDARTPKPSTEATDTAAAAGEVLDAARLARQEADRKLEESLADLKRTVGTARETGRVLRRHWVPIGLNFAVMFLLALAYLAGQPSGQDVPTSTGLMIALASIALPVSGGGLVACGCFAVSRAKAAIKARRQH